MAFLVQVFFVWSKVAIFLGGIIIDCIYPIVLFFVLFGPELAEYCCYVWRHLLDVDYEHLGNEMIIFANGVKEQIWNFVCRHEQHLLIVWAVVLAFFTAVHMRWQNRQYKRNLNHRNADVDGHHNNVGYQNADNPHEDPNVAHSRPNNGQNQRRQSPVRRRHQRIYTDLPDEDTHFAYTENTPIIAQRNTARATSFVPNIVPSAPPYEDDHVHASGSLERDKANSLDDAEDDDSLCVICLDRNRATAIFPCGHTHMCETCTRNVMCGANTCPLCQRPIMEYRTVFI